MTDQQHPLGAHAETSKIICDPQKKTCVTVDMYEAHGKKYVNQHLYEMLATQAATAGTELLSAFDLMQRYPKSVTFYGGVEVSEGTKYYEKARALAGRICKSGFAVITGGGPGIMQAGNQGAFEACGYSIGFNIELPREQVINPYVTHGMNFQYFFTRKTAMHFSSEVALFFPGGFGTFDELFGLVTLIQTKKSPRVPILLVGSDFWNPFDTVIKEVMLGKFGTIKDKDHAIYTIVDDDDEIMRIINKAPLRNEYSELESEQEHHENDPHGTIPHSA